MNAQEKYDTIINDIEEGASDRYTSADELAKELAAKHALDYRELNAVMKFMTGDTALYYIKKRKLMAAYLYLISASDNKPKSAITEAIEISGMDNHSSFCKKFGEVFPITPKEAFMRRDLSLYVVPLTWSMISQNVDVQVVEGVLR